MRQRPEYRVLEPLHPLTEPLQEFWSSEQGHDLARLSGLFPRAWRIFVMGGLVRDLLLEQIRGMVVKPADADVVIDGAPSIEAVQLRLGRFLVGRNDFGGAKCRLRPGGALFDIWRIEDHTNMSAAPEPHTIEQLLRHNLLDIDAVLWDTGTGCLHDCGCQAAIQAGCIDLMGDQGICWNFLAPQAAHVLAVAFKTGFPLSDRASDFIRTACDGGRREDLLRISRQKLPGAAGDLEKLLESLLSGVARP